MDQIKQGAQQGMNQPQGNPGQEDYGDKGLDAVERKVGHGHTAPRSVNEKVTDAARGVFEKVTGKPVNPKVSN